MSRARVLFESALSLPLIPGCVHYAGNERFITKAFQLQRDAEIPFDVCCDLEDGAAVGREREQLALVIKLIAERGEIQGRVGVRIHDTESGLARNDVRELIRSLGKRIAFITLPKARSVSEVRQILSLIARSNTRIPLHVLIETREALEEVMAIAALKGVEALEFGLLDFISDSRGVIPDYAMKSPGQFEHALIVRAKAEIAAAALRYGKIASHNISVALASPAEVEADARRARQLFGFSRMWSIHPTQIQPIARAMLPDFSGIAEAEEILLRAAGEDWAPLRIGETLHDRASYRSAFDLVRRAAWHGKTLRPATVKLLKEITA